MSSRSERTDTHLDDDIEEAVVLPPSVGQPFPHKLLVEGGVAAQGRPAGLLHRRKVGRLLRLVLCRGKMNRKLSNSPRNKMKRIVSCLGVYTLFLEWFCRR
jgi:hypothetical protein